MKTKKVLTIILPNIQVAMTGVWRIDRAHDLVKLTYSDNSSEAAIIPADKWEEINESPFAIVSEVQSKRASS